MSNFKGIVVGVETLERSKPAIGWAMSEAAARTLPVDLVHVIPPAPYVPGSLGGGAYWPVPPTQEFHRTADSELRKAMAFAHDCAVDVPVTTTVRSGSTASELREFASEARLLVVGTRHSEGLRSALVGSTAIQLAHTADSPFVVVREKWQPAPDAPVVVGVEPTTDAAPVLAEAFEHASIHGRELRATFCWEPLIYAPHEHWPADMEKVRESADLWLSEALSGFRSVYPDVPVVRDLVCDYPAAGLVKASSDAAILFVGVGGSRLSRLLGSVAATVLHQASCPVEVVPR
jgi:nucleotide-binding universal stress UspA family protein